jgi:hypothetical protein
MAAIKSDDFLDPNDGMANSRSAHWYLVSWYDVNRRSFNFLYASSSGVISTIGQKLDVSFHAAKHLSCVNDPHKELTLCLWKPECRRMQPDHNQLDRACPPPGSPCLAHCCWYSDPQAASVHIYFTFCVTSLVGEFLFLDWQITLLIIIIISRIFVKSLAGVLHQGTTNIYILFSL